mmetsp:Transcript_6338/g.9327  ORF Transcript_6338/g.9327 Transcript_6338/m.9327 type:complete len:177 (+) Transcript_6338:175-705(+)
MTKEALQCVHLGTSMEHLAITVQIYLRMDRLDLAKQTLETMKQADEEAVLTQLASVYIHVYSGRSGALDAVHLMSSLSEQYGASTMLLNLMAVAQMTAGQYAEAENSLNDAVAEGEDVDTLVNMIVCYQQQGKTMSVIAPVIEKVKAAYPSHPFVQGLLRVEGAFERESLKYKVTA